MWCKNVACYRSESAAHAAPGSIFSSAAAIAAAATDIATTLVPAERAAHP